MLSPRSLHLGCGAQTYPEMGCLVPVEPAILTMGQSWPILIEVHEDPAASTGESELNALKVKSQ